MDFFDKTGKMAIGSRLRMLTDRVTADAAEIYQLYGVGIKPKWFPVLFALSSGEAKTITGIAREIGQAHPSVSTIVKEMISGKLVKETANKVDKRRTVIALSARGKAACDKLTETGEDVAVAVEEISNATRHDLWRAINEWEEQLATKSLLQRVKEVRRARKAKEIAIVPYEPRFQEVFCALNKEWITKYFELEDADLRAIEHPQEYIIDKGGYIFVGCYQGEPVGVCALLKMDSPDYDYELAKLAVSPKAQGLGMGVMLCEAVVEKARQLGVRNIFLESNTRLHPAIHIYKKVGFRELPKRPSEYKRADIWMELNFGNDNLKTENEQ